MPNRLSRRSTISLASFLSLASLASRGSGGAAASESLESLGDGFHEVPEDELARDPSAPPPAIDFKPLFAAGRQVVTWLCEVARSRTTDALDHTAIDRVDRAARTLLEGKPGGGGASEQDVLTVLGLLITAFETDLGLRGLADLAGAIYDVAGRIAPSASCDPILAAIRASIAGGVREAVHGGREGTRVVLPVVVRRRPRVAHGDEDVGAAPTVLIVQ